MENQHEAGSGCSSHDLFGWVATSERLPESDEIVVAFAVWKDGRTTVEQARYRAEGKHLHPDYKWDIEDAEPEDFWEGGWYEVDWAADAEFTMGGNVTHWIPLPNS